MAKRKISECLNVRINVGNYQHIELTKYAEEEIEYSSKEDLVSKEDSLRDDLISSMIRSMKSIPERLGKGVESAQEVEQSIKKAIPEWLANGHVPNIANNAKKSDIKICSEQKANKDSSVKESKELEESITTTDKPTVNKPIIDDDDELFEDDEIQEPQPSKTVKTSQPSKSEPVIEDIEEEPDSGKNEDLDDFFDGDDDLFK